MIRGDDPLLAWKEIDTPGAGIKYKILYLSAPFRKVSIVLRSVFCWDGGSSSIFFVLLYL